ncbi:MFS transporter [Brevibacillus humidisoli]|uniref:MFS transporter n=1 Tax=Brevibacillus humidisoli TaxID=2895522 RepID=UPI001E5DAE95|nr:MFS transporter [Brevibacillus humidisoli]UFJ40812.1 MFS transporter [Brevibacillus humidisoli]
MLQSHQNEVPTLDRKRFVPLIIYVIFFGVLNETVFNVSTPNISAQYGLTPAGVSWVVTVFIITFGLGQVIYGKLADLFSLRRLIVIGIIVYAAGSLIGFLLQFWYPFTIFGRAIQGAGASSIPALVMIVVARYFTQQDRGKLFGILTSTVSFAIGVGPVIGGFVSAYLHWSYLFLIPLFTLAAIPAFLKLLPESQPAGGKLDIPGAVLLGITITSLILYCTSLDWPYLIVTAVGAAAFMMRIRRAAHPFVEPSLLADHKYRIGLLIGFLIFGTVVGIMFVIPLMMDHLHHLATDDIGLVLFPGASSAVIFGTVAGNITVKKGSHFVVYTGLSLVLTALLLLAGLTDKWVWFSAMAMVLMYIGFSFVQTALAESITQILAPQQIGVGMGFYGLISFVSGAVGTAIVGKALEGAVLGFPLLPFIHSAPAHQYSNLLLAFALVVAVGCILYALSLGRYSPQSAIGPDPVGEG